MNKNNATNARNTTPDFSTMPPDATHWSPWNEDHDYFSGWYKENEGEHGDPDDTWYFKFGTYDPEWSSSSRADGLVQAIYKFAPTMTFHELKVGDILQNTKTTSFPTLTLVKITFIEENGRVHVTPLTHQHATNFGKEWYENKYHFVYRPESSSSENEWIE